MNCAKCYVYVHDTISRPFTCTHIHHARALEHGHHLFASELVRIARGEEDDIRFLATLFVEAGGVSRMCLQRDPMPLANLWIHHQLQQIGDIRQIHAEHTPAPLRIRIPGKVYLDTTPSLRRIRIPTQV